MKVSNKQKPSDADDGVSRETLNDWQRRDAKKQSEATHQKGSENEAGKQADG
jgi:hypothetical protein